MHAAIEAYYSAMPAGATPSVVLGCHDRHRLATRFGPANVRSAGLLLLTLWGQPTMYYGDELGMTDVPIPPDKVQDPWGLQKPDDDVGRDPERTPMQWDDSPHAGFTTPDADPWLPVAPDYATVNVAVQRQDPTSILNFYKALLRLRHQYPVLHRAGDFQLVDGLPDSVLAYTRTLDAARVLVAINFSDQPVAPDLSRIIEAAEVLLSTYMDRTGYANLAGLALRPYEGVLLSIQEHFA